MENSYRIIKGSAYKVSKVIPNVNDLNTLYPDISTEWDYVKNSPHIPSNIAAHSNKKYWWICNNHSYQATPGNRTYGYGCPYCSGRLPIVGYSDLATLAPKLLDEWDYDRNLPFTPDTVSAKSNRLFWWRCSKKHEWQDKPCQRVRGDGCPYCSGHRVWKGYNDLASINPVLALEWNYNKNMDLKPDQITANSSKKVWWKCKYGHEWSSTVCHRNNDGLGCPYCSGRYVIAGKTDLATVNPMLAKEWHPPKNGNLTLENISAFSEKKVWWLCPL